VKGGVVGPQLQWLSQRCSSYSIESSGSVLGRACGLLADVVGNWRVTVFRLAGRFRSLRAIYNCPHDLLRRKPVGTVCLYLDWLWFIVMQKLMVSPLKSLSPLYRAFLVVLVIGKKSFDA
jgi:hypothetical protein